MQNKNGPVSDQNREPNLSVDTFDIRNFLRKSYL